jgi:hypothetical protein
MLLNPKVTAGCKFPFIYAIASILKKTRGQYIPLIEITAPEQIYVTYKIMENKKEGDR